jgi:hypothetical protein
MGAGGGVEEQAYAPTVVFENIKIEENKEIYQILIKATESSLN